ncbi:helix-turn-helix domain-containing protein [Falsiroseomonas sp.]|uniref:helix-turn-helix domain-containing protein n=1 Tax=Falsiroseomonas sp. TaxID=2870721 RepID=UPI0035698819
MPYELKRRPRLVETEAADAARIGDELRESRLALGHTLQQMAASLRIRRAYLEALEEGRLRDLPAPAYAVGFVRSYADALGLDPDDMVRRFREASGRAAAAPKLVFPEPAAERAVPTGALAAMGAVFAVCGYVAWFNWSNGGGRIVDAVPPVPPRLEQAAELGRAQLPGREALIARSDAPATRDAEAGALPLAALPPPGGLPPLPPPGANTSAQAATMSAAGAAPVQARPPAEPVATPPVEAPPPAEAAPAAPPVVAIPGVPEGTRVVLRARAGDPEGAWVQVRDPRSGRVLVNRVLRSGEIWAVPAREGLLLDTGRAQGLEILVDGQPQPVLEGLTGVRRNIALAPDGLAQPLVPPTAAAARN